MARDRSGTGRIRQILSAFVITGLAANPTPAAASTEQGGLLIRHVPDFSAISLMDSPSLATKDCEYPELGCDDPDLRGPTPDLEGLRRDTRYFVGIQFVTIGILYLMPESVSSWSDEEKDDYSLSKWWDNVRHPKRDTDDYFINYVLHPYCGASYFVRARERGYDDRHAFWYSVLLSSAYEFGPEAMFEEPSVQDLVVTPVVGSLLGKYFMRARKRIESRSAERGYRTRRERWVWALTDPLGAVNHRIDHLLGRDAEFLLTPYFYNINDGNFPTSDGHAPSRRGAVTGIRFEIRW
jgi:hypothetical protein